MNDPNDNALLARLNPQQREAVCHGDTPLLIIAGAGTGKTQTLVHRVAHLIQRGVPAQRILLLTFTRRAAAEMLRRVEGLLRGTRTATGPLRTQTTRVWGGTFHATATRLLRVYGNAIGLTPDFTILDRTDAEDLMNVIRTDMGLSEHKKRFPKKGTCMAIYSHCINSQSPLEKVLQTSFPWCRDYASQLKELFKAYVERKDVASVLDYDDLLLFWNGLLNDDQAGDRIRDRFDCVLVDEYQDTNQLQGRILKQLRPDGSGLTAVGDDCQSIYSFRAATVRNILDFPKTFPGTRLVKLEQNYRSTEPILKATNNVIAQAGEQFTKRLWSSRTDGEQPNLVTCQDDLEQTDELIRQVLEHREAGILLRDQAVLFRTSHHSVVLEGELTRHNIPYVKYGGLKFIESAHVKDVMAVLRLAENPKDIVAGLRVLVLLPGIGPGNAKRLMNVLIEADGKFDCWRDVKVPQAAASHWPDLVRLMRRLTAAKTPPLPAQLTAVRKFYRPWLEEKYDAADARLRDIEQLEQLASRFEDRRAMLSDIALDPPNSTEDFAGPPLLDEDYLILSTIHSAKGLEWDAVYVIHAADGNIPSDMATGDAEQIDEERRLFYVALTRAKSWLYVYFPQRYYQPQRGRYTDAFNMAQVTRFIDEEIRRHFDCRTASVEPIDSASDATGLDSKRQAIRRSASSIWS
jgi:DNA helicase-2/ATP-dependent DNA helicase PcrA